MLDWFELTIFFNATVQDVAVLAAVGIMVSAWIWFIFEAIKKAFGWRSPHPWWRQAVLIVGPPAVGMLVSWHGIPLCLEAVDAGWPDDLVAELRAGTVLAGLTAGLGAQVAHEHAERMLDAVFSVILKRIEGIAKGSKA